MIRKSLCCISLELQTQGIRSNTMTRKRFFTLNRNQSISILGNRVLNNLEVVLRTIKYCTSRGWNYRISSNIFPLITLPEANLNHEVLLNKAAVYKLYEDIAQYVKSSKIRCSTHPDQFVVPASSNPNVVTKSLTELIHHADMMDKMGLPRSYDAPINIHMNCFKGSLSEIANRFISIYKTLPVNVTSRLVLENEDKLNSWNVEQLYKYVYQQSGIPITYDNLHHKCNPGNISAEKAVELAMSTWGNYRPLFHYSESVGNVGIAQRSHADKPSKFPSEFLGIDVDLEFEFKQKDLAILHFENHIEKLQPEI
jgi:UV DNA damage endonuclease